jgi:hypothetical protein
VKTYEQIKREDNIKAFAVAALLLAARLAATIGFFALVFLVAKAIFT